MHYKYIYIINMKYTIFGEILYFIAFYSQSNKNKCNPCFYMLGNCEG